MTWAQRIATFRFWLSDNGASFGVPVALLAIGLILALGLFAITSVTGPATGPGQEMAGRVISTIPPADPADYNHANVMVELVDGMRLRLHVPLTQTCLPGAAAVVIRTPIKGSQIHDLKSCAKLAPQKGDDGPRQAG
jgi:hypothetical protein